TGMYSVLVRLQSPIDSRELVLILKGLLDSIKSISSRKVPPQNIDLDLDYVFIRRDGKVLLTLWALEGLAPKRPLPVMLKQIGELAKPNAKKDKNFIEGYLELFGEGFTMAKLDKFVNASYEMLKKSVIEGSGQDAMRDLVRDEPKPKPKPAERPKPTPQPVVERQAPPIVIEEEEDDDFLVPTNETTFLTDIGDELEDDGATTILTDEFTVTRYLLHVHSGERFDIPEGESVIGKQADISININSAISRKHAKVVVFDGTVTIEDVGSSNGTKLNGNKIEPHEPEQLMSGDVITFA